MSKLCSCAVNLSHPEQRKCWWDGVDVDLAEAGESPEVVKLWARRVWTLELSLVRECCYFPSSNILLLIRYNLGQMQVS